MEIDFEISSFFNNIASMNLDLMDYERWCRKYESFSYPKWVTKDGKEIALCDMSNEHLDNAIALVKNNDPDNDWVNILNQEKTYRYLKTQISTIKSELSEVKEIIENI